MRNLWSPVECWWFSAVGRNLWSLLVVLYLLEKPVKPVYGMLPSRETCEACVGLLPSRETCKACLWYAAFSRDLWNLFMICYLFEKLFCYLLEKLEFFFFFGCYFSMVSYLLQKPVKPVDGLLTPETFEACWCFANTRNLWSLLMVCQHLKRPVKPRILQRHSSAQPEQNED